MASHSRKFLVDIDLTLGYLSRMAEVVYDNVPSQENSAEEVRLLGPRLRELLLAQPLNQIKPLEFQELPSRLQPLAKSSDG
jgi:hypothetical protein